MEPFNKFYSEVTEIAVSLKLVHHGFHNIEELFSDWIVEVCSINVILQAEKVLSDVAEVIGTVRLKLCSSDSMHLYTA